MKRLIIIFFFLTAFHEGYAQTDNPTFNAIYNMDFFYYENKPVDSFLTALPQNYLSLKFIGQVKNNRVRYLSVTYPNHVKVYIQVKNYVYMNPVDPNREWDISLFRRENLSRAFTNNPYTGFDK